MTTTRRRTWRTVLAATVVCACMGFVVWGIARDIDEVQLQGMVWTRAGRAAAVLVVAYVFRAGAFGVLLKTLDASAPLSTSARIFLAAQLGRYIPGKVWQVAGAGYLGSQFGVSGTASAVATAYFGVIHNLVGALLGVWVVSRAFPNARPNQVGVALLVAGLLAVAFASSPLLSRMIAWIGRKAGRTLELGTVPLWALLFTIVSSLCVWGLFGAAVVESFGAAVPSEPAPTYLDAVSSIAAASIAGLAVLVAPAGIGVREAVFVAAFSGAYPVAAAGLVALLLRVLMSGVELVLSGLSLIHAPK